MKKALLGLAMSALFINGMAYAEISNDTSATISITGTLEQASASCTVMLSESSVSILDNTDTIIKQGENATNPTLIHASVQGTDECAQLVADGKIAYKFKGTADDADGNVLANALTDGTAATGVGIGIFDENNNPVEVNTGTILAKEDTTFGLQMVELNGRNGVAGNINATVTVQIERL
ncbi:fimbrial protein [Cronobacter dublinensis]|nr:fimbrial protein [Cronobacter dublinensis]EKF2292760.1 fimbrial protein [Cronobacter dublinensis]EKF2297881.1 fimbrial protein [Cronobacter dublinensis]EKK5267358.1 fimbrial protein [Cronobacter dublinensis]EKM0137436.1 fimbrial protein [Cronobacter dublinensis]